MVFFSHQKTGLWMDFSHKQFKYFRFYQRIEAIMLQLANDIHEWDQCFFALLSILFFSFGAGLLKGIFLYSLRSVVWPVFLSTSNKSHCVYTCGYSDKNMNWFVRVSLTFVLAVKWFCLRSAANMCWLFKSVRTLLCQKPQWKRERDNARQFSQTGHFKIPLMARHTVFKLRKVEKCFGGNTIYTY